MELVNTRSAPNTKPPNRLEPSLLQRGLMLPQLQNKANKAHAKEPSGLSESFLQRCGWFV